MEFDARRTQRASRAIDPVALADAGDADSHRDAEVRGVLAPLADLAMETNVAGIYIAGMIVSTQLARPWLWE